MNFNLESDWLSAESYDRSPSSDLVLFEHLFLDWLSTSVKFMHPPRGETLERSHERDWLLFSVNERHLIGVHLRETTLNCDWYRSL